MFKKLLSMLMVGILSTTLLVGCNSTQQEADNAKTKIEEAKEENMKQTKKEDNKLEDKLQTKKEQTKKEDTKQTTKQGTKQDSSKQTTKEKTSTSKKDRCWLCNRIITNENFGGYSNDGTMICYKCLNKYGKDEPEEPKQEGYYITCPNGHRVYTENGDYDCQRCYEDYLNEQYEESIQEADNADIDTYSNDYEQEYEEQEYEEQEYDEDNE